MKKLGMIILVIGGIVLLASFGLTTTSDDTYNIGLLQHQMMVFESGVLMVLAGTVAAAVGTALARLESAGILPPADVAAPLGKVDDRS